MTPSLKPLAAVMLAALCVDAHAGVALGDGGLGQGLLYPYFTTRDGKATLFSVQNATMTGKALKIRVQESYAGRDTLLFNIFLPPMATWSAALTADASGGGLLQTPSNSCTVPALADRGQALRNYAYIGTRQDGGSSDLARTREGQIEIIEMATLDTVLSGYAADPVLANCNQFLNRYAPNGVWTNPNTTTDGLLAPSGGLRGEAIIVDVAGGTAFDYPAIGFTGLSHRARNTTPGDSHPRLHDIQVPTGQDVAVNTVDDDGDPVTLMYPVSRGADAISALLARTSTAAPYNVSAGLDARTDWIVAFPTRYAYIDDAPGGTLPPATSPIAPFTSRLCESATLVRYDADGDRVSTSGASGNEAIQVCGQSQAIRFRRDGDDSVLLGSDDGETVTVDDSGLAVLTIGSTPRGRTGINGLCARGVPAWVFAVSAYDNNEAQPGRIATYPESRLGSGPRELIDCTGTL